MASMLHHTSARRIENKFRTNLALKEFSYSTKPNSTTTTTTSSSTITTTNSSTNSTHPLQIYSKKDFENFISKTLESKTNIRKKNECFICKNVLAIGKYFYCLNVECAGVIVCAKCFETEHLDETHEKPFEIIENNIKSDSDDNAKSKIETNCDDEIETDSNEREEEKEKNSEKSLKISDFLANPNHQFMSMYIDGY